MTRRVLASVAIAALALTLLGACSSSSSNTSDRAAAEKQTTMWIADAASAVSLPSPSAQVRSSTFENCRSDHGFFVTSSEWRQVVELTVPASGQVNAQGAIETAFRDRGWTSKTKSGILTLTGPKSARGEIRVESGGDATLVIAAISACYHS